MLVEDYDATVRAYEQLPSAEAKEAFLALFDYFEEDELYMGPIRIEMALNDLVDDDEASQKLTELNNLIDQNAACLGVEV